MRATFLVAVAAAAGSLYGCSSGVGAGTGGSPSASGSSSAGGAGGATSSGSGGASSSSGAGETGGAATSSSSTASSSGSGGTGGAVTSSSGGGAGSATSSSSSASSSSGSASSSSSGGPVVCPPLAGGSVVWTSLLAPVAPQGSTYALGPIAPSPSGDVYVSDAYISLGQSSRVYRFSTTGANLGSTYVDGGTGTAAPVFVGADPLGDLLFAYTSSGLYVRAFAAKSPPGGTGSKKVGSNYDFDTSPFELTWGNQGGDAAGHWLVGVDIGAGFGCQTSCGFDFGNGMETGKRVLRYDAAGTYLGSIPSPGRWQLAPSGEMYVVNGFQGTIDVGCGPVTGGAGPSTVLAKLDLNGACLWSKGFAAPAPAVFTLGGDGSLVLGFLHAGTIDLGGGPLPDLGGQNLTVATLDLAGDVIMSRTFGGAGAAFTSLTVDTAPSGVVVLGGGFSGTVDLGAGPLGNAGDTFLAALDASGSLRWSKVVNVGGPVNPYESVALRMTRQPCSMVIATDSPSVDLGGGPVVPAAPPGYTPDIAVVALAL